MRGTDSLPRKRAEYCRFHAIDNPSSVTSLPTFRKRKFHAHPRSRIHEKESNFDSIDLSRRALAWRAATTVVTQRGYSTFSKAWPILSRTFNRAIKSTYCAIQDYFHPLQRAAHVSVRCTTILNEPKSDHIEAS